jgi:hypothetical protein
VNATDRQTAYGRSVVRRLGASTNLEVFFISAVVMILAIRGLLALTGYPRLGGGGIHIAHMLWGGLGMTLALVLLFALEGRTWFTVAAVLGGAGFGTFIDELGKLVTDDNDYFFRPAIALIYLVFVGLYFLFRRLARETGPSPQTALVNAFDYAKEAVLRDLDQSEKDHAFELLGRCAQDDPLVISLEALLHKVEVVPPPEPHFIVRVRRGLDSLYRRLVVRRWFKGLLVGYFVVVSLVSLTWSILHAEALANLSSTVTIDSSQPVLVELGALATSLAVGILVVIGIWKLRTSKLDGYRWFERAMLVSILVGQFFAFYRNELAALAGLSVLLLTWTTVRYMIGEERREAAHRQGDAGAASTGGSHGTPQV